MFELMRLAIFDMDGLTLDTERAYYEAQIGACERHRYRYNKEKMIEAIGSRAFDLDGFYCGHIPADGEAILDQAYEDCVRDLIRNGVRTKKGIPEMFSFLNNKKIPVCIATSNYRDMAMKLLHSAGVDRYISDVITYNDVNHSKPEPDIFLEALRRFDTQPSNAIVFEDSENGAIAAKRAGIACVLVPDLKQPTKEIQEQSLMTVSSMEAVLERMECELG